MSGAGPEGDAGNSARVLVVDDEPDVAEVCSLWLRDTYDVIQATDGDEALERVDDSVDVVLLDRLMPGRDGDEVLERIRAEGYGCRVAMVTAVDPDLDVLELPFDAYLVKPVSESTLVETVDRLVSLSTADPRLRELYRLSVTRAALEDALSTRDLESSQEYAELLDRIEEVRADADLEGADPETFAAIATDGVDT